MLTNHSPNGSVERRSTSVEHERPRRLTQSARGLARRALLGFAYVATLVTTACDAKQSAAPKVLSVGVILPETGTLAQMGFYERHAMELARATTGDSTIRLIFEDTRSTPTAAAAAANKLISVDQVDLLVASTTGAALAVQPIARAAKIPLLAFCMDPTISGNDSSTVRFYIGVDEEAGEILRYLETLPATERVAILHAEVPVWRKIVQSTYLPRLRGHFATAPVVEEYSLQDRDYRALLGRLAVAKPTTLIVLGYGFEYPGLFKQMTELRLRSTLQRVVGGWGFLYTSLPPADLEGIVVAGPRYVFSRTAAADSFAQAFQRSTGRPANFDAAFAYELVRTLPTLRAAGALSDSTIKRGVSSLGRRHGVVGGYTFTPRGDMIVETGLGVYRGGTLTPFPQP